jgi:hypothetical protein
MERERIRESLPTPGDVRVEVTIRLQEFAGSYENVWLSRPELQSFLGQLSDLIETRKGKAELHSMSPDEFWLEIRPADTSGHFEVATQLKRHQYGGTPHCPTVVAGGFALDTPQLDALYMDISILIE